MSVYQRSSDGRWIARVKVDGRTRYITGTDRDEVVRRAAEHDERLRAQGPDERRFWSKVIRGTNCWLWRGGMAPRGYGVFTVGTTRVKAHRYAYALAHGAIPDGLHLDHLCHNPWCVRPSHMEPVTPQENSRRKRPVVFIREVSVVTDRPAHAGRPEGDPASRRHPEAAA